MKSYRWSGYILPLILTLSTRWRLVVSHTQAALLPRKELLPPTEKKVGWDPEPILRFWRRE